MRSIDKALSLLGIFSSDEPRWTVEEASARTGLPRSTVYRYFRSLNDAGLIVTFAAGHYVVGPGVMELDRVALRTDPLIVAAKRPMDDLAQLGPEENVVLLSRLYRRRVLCVDHRPHGHEPATLPFERGRPLPLYRGSISRIILANLNSRIIARYYAKDHAEIAAAGLGENLREFRRKLRMTRRTGLAISYGEHFPGMIGIAAPVSSPEDDVFASMGMIIPDRPDNRTRLDSLTEQVNRAALATSAALCTQAQIEMRQA